MGKKKPMARKRKNDKFAIQHGGITRKEWAKEKKLKRVEQLKSNKIK